MIKVEPSIPDLVAEGIRRLTARGVSNAAQEGWWIWEGVTGRTRAEALAQPAKGPSEDESRTVTAAFDRRVAGEPLAHVLATAEFRHLTLQSDRRALIPRPETEGLVDLVLQRQPRGRVLDLGTGTGCIALSLIREGDYELVVGLERSASALELAKLNVAMGGCRVRLIQGDVCGMFRPGTFDVLVSNPPYLTDDEYARLDGEVRDWEPEFALRAGADGMDVIRHLLRGGREILKPGGWLALEIDSTRGEETAGLAVSEGWFDVTVLDDLFGRARYLLARRSE